MINRASSTIDGTKVGLLDTSVLIDLELVSQHSLPERSAIAAVTLAELAVGPHTATDPGQRAARVAHLQVVEASYDPLPFDAAAARHYGHLVAQVVAAGQSPRPRRIDLMIAATAHANSMPLYTRNAKELAALVPVMAIVPV
jgi:predicted nucleic acid-binding protein